MRKLATNITVILYYNENDFLFNDLLYIRHIQPRNCSKFYIPKFRLIYKLLIQFLLNSKAITVAIFRATNNIIK